MKKMLLLFSLSVILLYAGAQNVGIGTTSPEASAQLDVNSTTKGFLPPRMTAAQRAGIIAPANGLLVYQTDPPVGLYYFNGGAWSSVVPTVHYPSVTICNQKWMDKNLDVVTYRNGDSIPYVPNSSDSPNAPLHKHFSRSMPAILGYTMPLHSRQCVHDLNSSSIGAS